MSNFTLMSSDLTLKSLSNFEGKKKVISIVPSMETDLCSTQTRTFNKELSELEDTVVITVSVDLPFAQARWCGAEGLDVFYFLTIMIIVLVKHLVFSWRSGIY